jgi:hypothetical protein
MHTQMKDASHTGPEMECNKYNPELTGFMLQANYNKTPSTGE